MTASVTAAIFVLILIFVPLAIWLHAGLVQCEHGKATADRCDECEKDFQIW